jgi:hypothetical protein
MTDKSTPPAKAANRGFGHRPERPYDVGDRVDVFCDHNRGSDRVRDWLQGVVVQADYKMVAVQFNEDVYLTDGWMIPDRVLWTRQDDEKIRYSAKRRRTSVKNEKMTKKSAK